MTDQVLPRSAAGYGVAMLLVLLALGFGLLLGPDLEVQVGPLLFIAAGVLAAWFTGPGPALAAVLLSTLLVDYFWAAPRFSLSIDRTEIPWFIAFVLSGLVGMGLSLQRRRFERELAKSHGELEQRVAQRTEQLHVSEERWRRLFETSSVGIAIAQPDGHFLRVNRALQAMLGYSELALQQMTIHDLIDAKGQDAELGPTPCIGETRLELPLRRQDRQIIWVDLSLSVIPATEHTPALASAVVTDVTARHRAVEDWRHAQIELGRASRLTTMGVLAGSIAHEVNQPLSAVVTYGQALLRWLQLRPPDLPEAIAAGGRIIDEGNRAAAIIHSIRQALAPAGASLVSLSMNGVIRQLVPLIETELNSQEVELRLDLAEESAQINGDRVQMQQVMLNLVMNSLDSLRGLPRVSREIIIATRSAGGQLVITVEDNGKGLTLPSERLFEPFFTTKPDGMGVGLALCHWVVESHGGQIEAEPRQPAGARFILRLPLVGAPDGTSTAPPLGPR